MRFIIRSDKYLVPEILASVFFILMAFTLNPSRQMDGNHNLFWVILLGAFAFLQTVGIIWRRDLSLLRLIMTWTSGSVLTWLAYANSSGILFIPMLLVGMGNFVSFVHMCDNCQLDWHKNFRTEK